MTSSLKLIKKYEKKVDLTELYKIGYKVISTRDYQYINQDLLKKLINANQLHLNFSSSFSVNLIEEYLKQFQPESSTVSLVLLSFDLELTNSVLDLLPKYQTNLRVLLFMSWNLINFNFLFELKHLKEITAHLYHPLNSLIFLKLVKEFKQIDQIEIVYGRGNEDTKEKLSKLKENVLSNCGKGMNFKIEIRSKNGKKDCQLIRLVFTVISYLIEIKNKMHK